MSLTILCDLDSIAVDLLTPWLAWYNSTHQDNAKISDLLTFEIVNHIKHPKRIWEFFKGNRYRDIPPMPGAQDALFDLHDAGHDIVIATATAGKTADIKWELVAKHFPFIKPANVMVGKRKDLLWGDVLIDDGPHNLESHHKRWPQTKLVTIAHPYNTGCKEFVDCYAEGYEDPAAAWQTIAKYILSLSDPRLDSPDPGPPTPPSYQLSLAL